MGAPGRHPVVDPKTGIVSPEWLLWFAGVEDGSGLTAFTNVSISRSITGVQSLAVSIDANTLTGTTLAPNVVNSSLTSVGTLTSGALGAGFTVNLSTVGVTGNLSWSNLPYGAGTWTAEPTIIGMLSVVGGITVLDDIVPLRNFRSNLGLFNSKFLSLYCAELFVETLVAQDVMATIGGRIVVAPTTFLTADLLAADTTITVKHNNLLNGHRVRMEGDGHVEWMAVTSAAGGTAGLYTYTVTRNLDGTGANDWFIGDAVLNTGTVGDGFIDMYSTAGVLTGVGPTIVGNERAGTDYDAIIPRWAIGNLNGLYDYVTDLYGVVLGEPLGPNLTMDPVNGLRIRQETEVFAQMNASFFALGLPSGNRVTWDGAELIVLSEELTIDSSGISLACSSVASFTRPNAYRFRNEDEPDSNMGLSGSEGVGGDHLLFLSNTTSGAGVTPVTTINVASLTDQTVISIVESGIGIRCGLAGLGSLDLVGLMTISSTLAVTGATSLTGSLTATATNNSFAASVNGAVTLGLSNATNGVNAFAQFAVLNSASNGIYLRSFSPTYSGSAAQFANGAEILNVGGATAYVANDHYFFQTETTGVARLNSGGSLKLGNITNPAFRLELDIDSAAKPTTATWTIVSDERAKENITPYEGALDQLRQVQIRQYDYTGEYDQQKATSIGPLAQEIAAVFPRTVKPISDEDDLLTFNPHEMFMATTKAVIELDAIVRDLRAQVAALTPPAEPTPQAPRAVARKSSVKKPSRKGRS